MPPVSDSAPRVNMRMIAARAGVSLTTVSFAFRNSPRIPEATRQRVMQSARELGYRPDPQIAKLMHHLRARRAPGFQSTLCAITTISEDEELPYLREIVLSARQRAEAQGYKLMLLRIEEAPERRPDLERMLLSRGVEGLLLLPVRSARSFQHLLDWSKFAAVAATNAVLAPEFHRVVPHQFGNMLAMCHELVRRGYRRIGMVEPAQHELTVNQSFSAALMWQSFLGGTEPVMPLLYDGPRPEKLKPWFEEQKPDAIIATGEVHARAIAGELQLRIPGPVGFATANRTASSRIAGIEERPQEIGAAAIRLLASLLQHGEKGIPAVPTVTMVKGQWVETTSVRRAQAAKKPAARAAKR